MNQRAVESFSKQRHGDLLQLGLFDIEHLRFGIEIEHLSEVCVAVDILPIVSSRTEVVGSLRLRGQMIPIIDLLSLCGLDQKAKPPELIAIVQSDGRFIGIGVDKTGGISNYEMESAQPLYKVGDAYSPLVRRGILDDGAAVNIVDVARIFEQPDIPSCPANQDNDRGKAAVGQSAYLTFEAGGATFGMDAVSIFGTVPRQNIKAGAVSGSQCLGMIEYLNRKVPTVDCADLVGLGSPMAKANPEVVVVGLSEDRLVGLAVDVIRMIEFIDEGMLKTPPTHLQNAASLVSGYYLNEDDVQVFTLDPRRFETKPDLQHIADLSKLTTSEPEETTVLPTHSAADRTTRRCLVYTAGRRQTSDLTQVVTILETPDYVTPLQNAKPSVEGMFAYRGASVLLVDLAKASGQKAAKDPSKARVLLVRGETGDVGFLVDSVDGIETSDLVISEEGDRMGPIAQLGRGAHRTTLPIVDLHEMVASLSSPA